jgi:hypothetical protein
VNFATAAENSQNGNSGRSRRPADGPGLFDLGRQHPMITNWRCRPIKDIRCPELAATKRSLKPHKAFEGGPATRIGNIKNTIVQNVRKARCVVLTPL